MGSLEEREAKASAVKRKSFVETIANADNMEGESLSELSYYITNDLMHVVTIKSSDIDYIACKALKLECPEHIIPFSMNPADDSIQINYQIGNHKVNLHNFTDTLKIEQVLELYNNIIEYLEDCGNFFLNKTGFCFDTEYVFLDEQKKSIHLTYLPSKKYGSKETDLKQVFIELLEKCDASSGENIQLQLYKYFYKPKFSLKEFRRILDSLQVQPIKKVMPTAKPEPRRESSPQPRSAPQPQPEYKPEPLLEAEPEPIIESSLYTNSEIASQPKAQETEKVERNNYVQANIDKIVEMASKQNLSDDTSNKKVPLAQSLDTDEIADFSNSSAASRLSGESRSNSKLELPRGSADWVDSKRKNLFSNIFSTSKDSKVEIPPPEPQSGTRLKLFNDKSKYNLPKTIVIDFEDNEFTLGRRGDQSESPQSAFEFSQEVNPISRQHAKIEQRGDNYYLIDKGSRNGTFLNGKRIDANKPYQLYHNDVIAFAIAFSDNSIRYVFLEQ